ncbi:MAG: DUF2058 family protein [Rhodanobacteraceae bacterium]
MSETLRDQLLKAGLKPARKREPARPEKTRRVTPPVSHAKPQAGTSAEEVDLARAYALRAQAEKAERERSEREAQQQAQARRERKRRLHELLEGKSLNREAAEHPRHFEHAGKIRRVYVTTEQLRQINASELGVVVQAGRFVLVLREVVMQVQAIAPEAVALLVDPQADNSDDGVPADMMW